MLAVALDHLNPSQRHLIGVSGGRDSVVLLHALHALGFTKVIVCHVNHRLRGRASSADAAFVQRLAKRLGYACHTEAVDVKTLAQQHKQSIETAARHARHAVFARIAREQRCTRLILAHHAEDQAETVLMRVLRGTGIGGLAGMASETSLSVPNGKRTTTLQLLRPLLHVRRADIDAYAAEHRLKFREDASNADTTLTRNALRHAALPMLTELLGRDSVPMLVRLARVAEREDAFMASVVEQLITEHALIAEDGSLLLKPVLLAAHSAVQHRVLLGWLTARGVHRLSQDLVEEAARLLTQAQPARLNLPGALQLRRKEGRLWIAALAIGPSTPQARHMK